MLVPSILGLEIISKGWTQYTWLQFLDEESITIVNVCMPFKLIIKKPKTYP
jgi:hypothetical protein